MLADGRDLGMMDVVGPLDKVAVSAFAEAGEQRKFQMIVGVDKAWEQQETGQIDTALAGFWPMGRGCLRRFERGDAA